MGTFFAEVRLASPARPRSGRAVKLLVDSGSLYTWVPAAVLRELGAEPTERRRLLTIEGRTLERGAAEVLITIEGRTLHTLCMFGEPGDLPVLGAYTLEGFGLAIDPVRRRLIPSIAYGAIAAG
jgi:predicted aspartyl protease